MAEPSASPRPFAHLHCHTHYSLLDGASKIPELVKRVKELGMTALAVTDHGNLYGALEFYTKCKDAGINPILGYEAYITPGFVHHTVRDGRGMRESTHHLTLLAKNITGFKNLVKLATYASLEGFYYKPRISRDLLAGHHEGLICLSGCAAGELSQHLLGDRDKEAEEVIAWYHDLFKGDYYLEIQNAGFDIQKQCGDRTIDLAQRVGIPLVATNDAHYIRQEDADAHDVLLCVNTKTLRNEPGRMRMDSDQLFVRSPEQMYEAFPDHEDAVALTAEIAAGVDIELDLKTRHFPVFVPPENKTDQQYLRELCEKGIAWRYGETPSEEVFKRLDYELEIINRMGFNGYFLIVADFARFAREHQIPTLARGSACGAIVAYLLGLSNVCPLKYDLLFERFLDPSRVEAPDIDMDFCRDRRQMVIDYVKEKYGKENVAQIGTFGTLGAKAVIRDVARALGMPLDRADEVAKFVPVGPDVSLASALEDSPDLRAAYDADPQVRQVIDYGKQLEGLAKSAGTHAAGVVISDQPLIEYVPLQKITGKEDILTQWTEVEKAGLLKMDFLGLRNLTILDLAVKNVRRHKNPNFPDPGSLPVNVDEARALVKSDPDYETRTGEKGLVGRIIETFKLLQRGETKGIFQLESGGMRDLLTKMKPDSFNDIIATSALYRPGPLEGGMVMTYVEVKHGRQPITKIHSAVDDVLLETYGVMVYQEQVMRIINRLGGIELPKAYACIKAISKKKAETIEKNRAEFIKGAVERGMAEDTARDLFGLIEKFAGYGFNKSHSTAYAAIAYQTAYLKANYPIEFMAALLSCGMEDSERISEHVDDCRRQKIEVLRPDVNQSDVEFTCAGDKILFGLGAIRGVGDAPVRAIMEERQQNGPFKDIFELCERVDPKLMSKGVLELLIKAGALDAFGPNRAQHLEAIERAIGNAASRFRDKQSGQKNLFGGDEDDAGVESGEKPIFPPLPDLPQSQKLQAEKDVLGFYLTSHPLSQHEKVLKSIASHTTADLHALPDGAQVLIGGMISAIKRTQTKKPSRNGHTRYANFDFEDVQGVVRCIMWPEEFSRLGEHVDSETICFLEGKVDRRGREPNLIVGDLIPLDQAEKKYAEQVAIKFDTKWHNEATVDQARNLLKQFPGKCSVAFVVDTNDGGKPVRVMLSVPSNLKVSADPRLRDELTRFLGEGCMHVAYPRKRLNGAGGGQRRIDLGEG